MAGLSGGQRKLLLFELIFQRTAAQNNLLIVLDEPFAGVTDDFVPFIVGRLNEMRKNHNILLVTNDHVETLKKMGDNTVTVSAIDRAKVKINEREGVDRNLALLAMSIGDDYAHTTDNNDLKFFRDVEFSSNGGIPGVAAFTIVSFGLFTLTFWNSQPGAEALVLIAAGMISYFSINPYLLQLVDWRIYMIEEAEALLHSSASMNKLLKTLLTLLLLVCIASMQFGVMNLVIGTLSEVKFYVAILFDNASLMLAPICLGLYTDMPLQAVQILGAFPFLLMIFFSTTFSPGAGVPGLKSLRYLFSRFYLFCMTPGVDDLMEGCPESNTLLYLVLSSLLIPAVFVTVIGGKALRSKFRKNKHTATKRESMMSMDFAELQVELFGQKALKSLKHMGSTANLESLHELMKSKESKDSLDKGTEKGSDDEVKGSDEAV